MKKSFGHGHRRTESQYLPHNNKCNLTTAKIMFNPDNSKPSNVMKYVEESSKKNKIKTVCVQNLEVPKQSQRNSLFAFGQNGNKQKFQNSHFSNQLLLKIPQNYRKQKKTQSNHVEYQRQGDKAHIHSQKQNIHRNQSIKSAQKSKKLLGSVYSKNSKFKSEMLKTNQLKLSKAGTLSDMVAKQYGTKDHLKINTHQTVKNNRKNKKSLNVNKQKDRYKKGMFFENSLSHNSKSEQKSKASKFFRNLKKKKQVKGQDQTNHCSNTKKKKLTAQKSRKQDKMQKSPEINQNQQQMKQSKARQHTKNNNKYNQCIPGNATQRILKTHQKSNHNKKKQTAKSIAKNSNQQSKLNQIGKNKSQHYEHIQKLQHNRHGLSQKGFDNNKNKKELNWQIQLGEQSLAFIEYQKALKPSCSVNNDRILCCENKQSEALGESQIFNQKECKAVKNSKKYQKKNKFHKNNHY